MSTGLIFPGQGSQHVGMGRDIAERFLLARDTFLEADEALGFPLSQLCWEGPEAELTRTENAQPAILVHSVAVWRLLQPLDIPVLAAAGHSLGEWSAYVAAGTLSFADAVRTVRRRGELMAKAGAERPGTMAAVLGLDDEATQRVCAEASQAGGIAVPANYNAPGQVVISGDPEAVERAGGLARQGGAKRVLPLNVSGAFHSPLIASAEEGLRDGLAQLSLRDPSFPVVANATARPVRNAAEAGQLLIEQLTAPVRWVACVQAMTELGVTRFLELGPGNVLCGLVRRIERGAETRALGTAEALEEFSNNFATAWN
ncbi:ACP S-malonyltransferase [soil metagenome]